MKSFFQTFGELSKQLKKDYLSLLKNKKQLKNIEISTIEPTDYTNREFDFEEKINLEKRRRNQAYIALDYLFSGFSYFDFFSLDSFQITKKAKELSEILNRNNVTSDLLLVPFFDNNLEVVKLLEKYGVNKKSVLNSISKLIETDSEEFSLFEKYILEFHPPFISNKISNKDDVKYSYELHQIFKKASKNALERFKTPIINSEILLVTLIESKKSQGGKILKNILKTDRNWYMLRYELMKRLHSQELTIRNNVKTNQQYFTYLLKTQLSEFEFDCLVEKDFVPVGVDIFRNILFSEIIQEDLNKILKNEIRISMKSKSERNYTI